MALGAQLTETLSLGIILNIWNDSVGRNEWTQNSLVNHSDYTSGGYQREYMRQASDRYVFEGINANVGIMYQTLDQKISIGAVFKTPFRADLEHWNSSHTTVEYPDSPENDHEETKPWEKTDADEKLDMPMSYGIGFAYRFSDELTVAADVYRTEWGDFVIDDGNGEKSAVTGKPANESDIDPTHQVRVGLEYLHIGQSHVFPLRCGVFYDPAPAEGLPDDFWGFSLGTGIMWDKLFEKNKCPVKPKTVIFDIAYQYRFGNDVGGHIVRGWNFSQDVEEHTAYSSVIVHF